jgi:transcriptional regulator with XRE-family HTH domain
LISPLASRLWLASELAELVKRSGCTAGELARKAGVDPRKISYLLKAERKSSAQDISKILSALEVAPQDQKDLLYAAAEAEKSGWWDRFSIEMGSRQATYADLEAGAAICEFSQTLFPGLLQTEEYATGRAEADRTYHSKRFLVERAVEARSLRQKVLSGLTARGYEVILDEAVLRRAVAAARVMRNQINHIVGMAVQNSKVSVRLLRLGVPLPSEAIPATSFSIYHYRELQDLEVVAVETDDSDLFITDPSKTAAYRHRFGLLRSAALNPAETLEFLVAEAESLSQSARRSA